MAKVGGVLSVDHVNNGGLGTDDRLNLGFGKPRVFVAGDNHPAAPSNLRYPNFIVYALLEVLLVLLYLYSGFFQKAGDDVSVKVLVQKEDQR